VLSSDSFPHLPLWLVESVVSHIPNCGGYGAPEFLVNQLTQDLIHPQVEFHDKNLT
jgi:hypothetical protein